MKKLLIIFSFVLCLAITQSWSRQQEQLSSNGYAPENTLTSLQDSTKKNHKKSPTKQTKKDPSKTKYGVDKSSTVPGEAGSGSGVGDGGSINGADTMKIMR